MKRFVMYETHEYMDEFPETNVSVFSGDTVEMIENEAKAFCKGMNDHYSGGTTTFKKVMTLEEASDYANKLIAKEKANPQPDSEEFITNVENLFEDCYKTIL